MDSLLSNDFIAALIAFALVLIPVVIIHELGHFFAAKLVGISVLEFGIGFPPRVVKTARTCGSRNAELRSDSRSSSVPAKWPQERKHCG